MKRWLPLLLTLALALGCAGCARRQTVTVYTASQKRALPSCRRRRSPCPTARIRCR